MTNKEEINEKWNSFAESALLSLASPVAPRRSGNARRFPSLGLPLDEEEYFDFESVRRISRSLSPSTSNRGVKKDLDSNGTMGTSNTSFSTFGLAAPYPYPPRQPSRKPSGDGLVRPAEVSDAGKKRSSVSNGSEEEYEEEEDFFLDLNDHQSSKKEDSIRRFRRPGALVRAFSDSELSEASTINSGGENHKAAARARKQKLKEIQEARRVKIQMEKEKRKRRGKELEEDDLVDTDIDVAGFTGLAKPRSKSLDDIFETVVSPVGKSSPRSTPRSRNSGRKGRLGITSNHSKGRNRKGTSVGSKTKNRSDRRKTSSDEESSSEEEDALTNKSPRRGRKPSKRRPKIDGERNGSFSRRKGRRPPPPPPAEVTEEGSLHVPQRLIIDVTHPDVVSPCTVASRSVRDALSVISASASKMGSMRSKSTISSRMSGMTFITGCSSVSSGAFDDDFSKLSVQSNETIKSEQQSQTSERRFPTGSLATLRESSMTSFASLKKTPTSGAENESSMTKGDLKVSKSSLFMPHKPQRFPSGNLNPGMFSPKPKPSSYTPLSDCEDSSVEEKAIPMTNSSSDLMKEVKRPTLQKATTKRGMTQSSSDLMKEVKRPTDLLKKATSQRGMTKSSWAPTHLFQKATSKRGRRRPLVDA
jgi:hypothetical protein